MPGAQRCSITWWIDWWVMNGWIDEWSILSSLQELMAYYREISIAGHGKSGFGVNLPTALLRCFNFILQAMRSQQRCWNSNNRLVLQEVPQGSRVESSQGKGEAGGGRAGRCCSGSGHGWWGLHKGNSCRTAGTERLSHSISDIPTIS